MSLIRQEFDVLDYFGPLVVFAMFFLIVFTISFTCIMWFCITDVEKVEAVQKWKTCRPPAMCVRLMAKGMHSPKTATVLPNKDAK